MLFHNDSIIMRNFVEKILLK